MAAATAPRSHPASRPTRPVAASRSVECRDDRLLADPRRTGDREALGRLPRRRTDGANSERKSPRMQARLRPPGADRVERRAGRDAGQCVDDIRQSRHPSSACFPITHVAGRGAVRTQPSAGATISAISSIERRMKGCGGSIEWTCIVISVARAIRGSACSDAITSSGVADMHVDAAIRSPHHVPRRRPRGLAARRDRCRRARSRQSASPPCDHPRRKRYARRGCGAPGRRQGSEIGVDHRVLDVGQRQARFPAGRGWVRDSISPSPAAPARRAPRC